LRSQAQFEVENNARKTLAETVGGAALLVGIYFTWANLQVTQETATKDRELT
jgi:predicted transporter